MATTTAEAAAFDPCQPFNRAEARAAGLRSRELLGPRYHKVFYDCYVAASVPLTIQLRAQAALRVSPPGTYASHATAARLWGGAVPDDPEIHVSVLRGGGRCARRGIRTHVAAAGAESSHYRGTHLSTAEQTFLDLAAVGLDLVDLVILGDSLIARGRTSSQRLIDATRNWSGPGAKGARRAATFTRHGVDSPQESRLRMLLVLAGLPEPEVNTIVRHSDGSWKLRFDLSYADFKILIEYDGRQHAFDAHQWQRDLKRREELDCLGWRIIVVTGQDLFVEPAGVLARVRAALVERGYTGLRRPRTDWVRFFTPA